ncbi:DUF6471 domain-containing protein [Paraburkholderia tropica]|uniref:DUF6471 domain-containing protein n=1 Tax=Paraburkholderia tropica TaxID=92647 RepID=UPI002AB2D8A3|nr:DUF6471 domain-containing protein [Paraburkholderia tropica]
MTLQAKFEDSPEAAWSKLASRAVRVILARRDMSYAALAKEFMELGITESARSVEGKVQRGTFRFSFFLQALAASQADCPTQWQQALLAELTWEERASSILCSEIAQLPWLDWQLLSSRLAEIGIAMPAATLGEQVLSGTFSAALFLQCATVCRFPALTGFIDTSSLNDTVLAGSAPAR